MDLKVNLGALQKPTDITKAAFLVDREDFLGDIKELREKYHFIELIPRDNLQYWHYQDALVRKGIGISHDEKIARNRSVKRDIDSLMKKYNKDTPEYWQIIFASLLSGSVTRSDLTNKVCPIYTDKEIVVKGPQTLLGIYPNTTQEDLVNALKSEEVQFLLKQQERYANQLIDPKWNEIKTIRKWYWLNIGGMSYSDISEKETDDRMSIEKKVGTYVRRYKKRLLEPLC